jgi:hypothetical protein
VNKDAGQKAVKELQDEFGPNKVVFVQTDVTNMQNYEGMGLQCMRYFQFNLLLTSVFIRKS